MSLSRDLIANAIQTRNQETLNQTLQIVLPERVKDKTVILYEYDGTIPRVFGDDTNIELMLPLEMDTIVENAVVDAIENGTLFDDADAVNRTSDYIVMTKMPLRGMASKGINEPFHIKHAIGSVVGAMNPEGRFGADEVDIENGKNFTHDLVHHGHHHDTSVNDLVDSYLDAKNHHKLSLGYRRSLDGVHQEIDDINTVTPDDSIDDIEDCMGKFETIDHLDNVVSKKECGDGVGAVEEATDVTNKILGNMSAGEGRLGETASSPTDKHAPNYTESYVNDQIYERYIQESMTRRPKRLKPIPRDVVAYITVEINAIQDSNDQAMLASYTCSKLELVDFYITCIDTNDERYIVPHTRQYLIQMQNDLNSLLTRILQIRPVNKSDRMWKAILV